MARMTDPGADMPVNMAKVTPTERLTGADSPADTRDVTPSTKRLHY